MPRSAPPWRGAASWSATASSIRPASTRAPSTAWTRARRGAAAPDRFEREAETYHEGLRRAFLDNAGREPGRCLVVDAGRSLDDVAETLWLIVGRRFPALGRGAEGGAP